MLKALTMTWRGEARVCSMGPPRDLFLPLARGAPLGPPPRVLHMLVGRGKWAGWVLPPPRPQGLLSDADIQQGPL